MIRLTCEFPPQGRPLPLDLVRQRQVKGGSKCVMHNGMCLPHSTSIYLLLPLCFLSHPYPWLLTYIWRSTHRQRTQNYIKTLESEVVRLRESEMSLIQVRDKLQSQVDSLRTTVLLSNIPLPEGIEAFDPSSPPLRPLSDLDMPATVSYTNDTLDHPRLHVNFPQRQENSSQGLDYPTQTYPQSSPYEAPQQYPNLPQSAPDLPNGWWPIPYRMNTSGWSLPPDFSLNTMNFSSSSSRPHPATDTKAPAPVDPIETAIDCVLALEHPCMRHLPYPDPPSTAPAKHMMMASTALMARSPDPPQFNSSWTASGAIIKELLNLSSSINLEGEITPVEAWHRLHDHPDFWRLTRDQIESLKQELSTKVRCCGYVGLPFIITASAPSTPFFQPAS